MTMTLTSVLRLTTSAILLAAAMLVAQTRHATSTQAPRATAAPKTKLPSQQIAEAFLHARFGYDPNLVYKIVAIKPSPYPEMAELDIALGPADQTQLFRLYITPDGEHAIVGEVMPFGADPFHDARIRLEKEAKGPAKGAANNALLLVEFSDLECPHCKAAQPTIAKLLEDFPNARFVFENYPLPIHKWAARAAAYGQCIGERDNAAFFKYVDAVFESQDKVTPENADDMLKGIAKQAGADPDAVAQCAASESTAAEVKQSADLARDLGVTGTPALFVNGRQVQIGGMSYETLKSILQFDAIK